MNIREYYDEQRLSISSEDMTERVLKAANEKPKRRAFRKPVVIAAAAAVVLVGGVTAAATGLGFATGLFQQLFASKAELVKIDEYRSVIDFSEMGKELDIVRDYGDFKVNVIGIAADDLTAYVLYEMIPDEGFDYREIHGIFDVDGEPVSAAFSNGIISDGISGETEEDAIYCYSSVKFIPYGDFDTIEGRTLAMEFMYKDQRRYEDMEPIVIPIDFEVSDDVRIIELNQPISFGGHEHIIKNIVISTFGIEYNVVSDKDYTWIHRHKGDISYTFEGSDKQYENNCVVGSTHKDGITRVTGFFNYPVNTEDITSITIAGNTFVLD